MEKSIFARDMRLLTRIYKDVQKMEKFRKDNAKRCGIHHLAGLTTAAVWIILYVQESNLKTKGCT